MTQHKHNVTAISPPSYSRSARACTKTDRRAVGKRYSVADLREAEESPRALA